MTRRRGRHGRGPDAVAARLHQMTLGDDSNDMSPGVARVVTAAAGAGQGSGSGDDSDSGGTDTDVDADSDTDMESEQEDDDDASGHVVVIGATNRPDLVDAAVLRPGRMDRLVYVGLPDAAARAAILAIHARGVPLGDGVDLASLMSGADTDGLSGAEVASLVREAALAAMAEDPTGARVVAARHWAAALARVRPRTAASVIDFYRDWVASAKGVMIDAAF